MLGKSSIGLFATLALAWTLEATVAAARPLLAPAGGQIHALVVGIDNYSHLRPLKGAVADANDLYDTLKRAGVNDVTRFIDRQATRRSVTSVVEQIVNHAKGGDFVLLAFAGHGAQVRERVKGSKPDGRDEAYLLYDFNPVLKTPDMIIGPEMKSWLARLEANGVDVLFIVDTCFGGGMTRNWDARSGDLTYRDAALDAALAEATAANLTGVTTAPADSFRDESTFKRVTFLAAVDRNTLAPEVQIPGQATKRGALSYSVARAIEGIAGGNRGGAFNRDALFSYARQTVLQFSNNRQLIVTEPTAGTLDAVVWRTEPMSPTAALQSASAAPATADPVRIAVVNGSPAALESIKPVITSFVRVERAADAELVWDARAREVVVAGDVVAQNIGPADLPAAVDRIRAVSELARVSAASPQSIEILPDNKRHAAGKSVGVRAEGVRSKHAVIFNIAGNGKVQFLFPFPGDRLPIEDIDWRISFRVEEPFGADTVIAITSDRRLDDLAASIRQLDKRLAAGLVPQIVAATLQEDATARVGFASLFTTADAP